MILANTYLNDICFSFLQNITEAYKDTEMRQADKQTVKIYKYGTKVRLSTTEYSSSY